MPEAIAPSGTVHWIGTGLSTGAGLRVLIDRASRVLLWARTTEKARACLDRVARPGAAEARPFDPAAVAGELRSGDVVVCMLPATEHAGLLRLCVERLAHFACSSYVSEPILAGAAGAEDAGVVVLTEAGLDPGIDHLFAQLLVDEARVALAGAPATVEITSYCGGIPAAPNDFRYRFSWAPRSVLTALNASARYLRDGTVSVVERPWEATGPYLLDGEEFEVYPNRDSLAYVARYGVPESWRMHTFVRGTLRLSGWQRAWAGVFAELRAGDPGRIAALADDLARRYPMTEADRDRVVLAVALSARHEGGRWYGQYLLDQVGDAAESAMARCVSTALACGVLDILAQRMPPGLRQAAGRAETARRWLAFLAANGVPSRLTVVGENTTIKEADA